MKLYRILSTAILFALVLTTLVVSPSRAWSPPPTLTTLQVQQFGGDLEQWGAAHTINTPQKLTFRWETKETNVSGAVWQVSQTNIGLDTSSAAFAKVIRSGSVGFVPAAGKYAEFNINFAVFLPKTPPNSWPQAPPTYPNVYYVRVVPMKGGGRSSGTPSMPVPIKYAETGPSQDLSGIPTDDSGGPMPITIRLEKFKVIWREDSRGGEHDEPYILVVAIFADGTTVGNTIHGIDLQHSSVMVFGPPEHEKGHKNLSPDGVGSNKVWERGEETTIGGATGLYQRTIRPLPGFSPTVARRNSMVGIVVVAMEEDNTSEEASIEAQNKLTSVLRIVLNATVKSTTPQTIDTLPQRMKDIVAKAVQLDRLEDMLPISTVDPDDIIGAQFAFFSYQLLRDSEQRAIQMDFKRDRVHYRVTGWVKKG